jgi:hypothetical protein
MGRSETITKLTPALIAARGAMPVLKKDSDNPHFRSKYADLAGCLETCEPSLYKNGLAVLQLTSWADGVLTLETTLTHTSGEWVSSLYPILTDYSRPQLIGAALTYARRYSYMAVVGVAPEDDDGEMASGRGHNGHANGHANGHSRPVPIAARPPARPRCTKCQTDLGELVKTPLGLVCWECCERDCAVCKQRGKSRTTLANGTVICRGCYKRQEEERERAAFVAEPAPTAGQASRLDRPPISGRELYRWAAQIAAERGRGIIAHILDRGRGLGLPDRIISWSSQEVPEAYQDALEALELVYDPDRADPDYDDGQSN